MIPNVSLLWRAPELNSITKKARSIPVLNIVNVHGRVFFFSWLGFMLAFWAWYAFPPLLTVTIKKDLNLSPAQVANSNIVSLCATLLLRLVAGPLCDRFGPRRVFASLILLGCLPVGLAPLVQNATGLYISRFFMGVLGATFVPCQVWCTGFFEKNVVGTANALAGGWGNAGGGATYFIMPAVFDSLVDARGLTSSEAWRVTFVVPLVCLIACGLGLFLLCPDTPLGEWEQRSNKVEENLVSYGNGSSTGVDVAQVSSQSPSRDEENAEGPEKPATLLSEAASIAKAETVVKPSFKESWPVLISPQTLFHVVAYSCSFGGELAINSILSAYYLANFPYLGQSKASNYAAIFGFLNVVTRPLGGVIGDVLYNKSGRKLWIKKSWITTCGLLSGAMLIIVGLVNPSAAKGGNIGALVGLVSVAAIFIEAGNGAIFCLVPHVHPHANGIVSGVTGGGGNLGGVVFAIIFRFIDSGKGYHTALWVIGVIHIGLNLAICWIPTLPKGQVGGQ